MRIALDARYLDGKGSGIGSYTLGLARALLEEDSALELLLVRGALRTSEPVLGDDPRVKEVRFPFPPNSPATRIALGPFLEPYRFDLFHAPFAVMPTGLSRPMVVTVHDLMWAVNPRFNSHSLVTRLVAGTFFRRSLDAAMNRADLILAVSEATRAAIAEHSPWHGKKVRVIPNGFARSAHEVLERKQAFRTIASIVPEGTPFVLTVGDASPHKNHLNAVRGFLEAFAGRSDYRMILVRRFLRRDPAMSALLRCPLARERVIALPHVSREMLDSLFCAARIYLHPSYYEGFGIPLLEAMAAGTPIVTSHTSCLPEVAGPAALLVDPSDPMAIAGALQALEHDDALRARIVAEGQKRLDLFTWNRCARATLAAYRELAHP